MRRIDRSIAAQTNPEKTGARRRAGRGLVRQQRTARAPEAQIVTDGPGRAPPGGRSLRRGRGLGSGSFLPLRLLERLLLHGSLEGLPHRLLVGLGQRLVPRQRLQR